ncbi:DEAD/DEAH box helicase family protein [Pseudoalteromonas sp. McH1-7]|uniref:SNF2-related protein n=1 Tax=Pseudoalteromonas TaxID=53246 RepID=UPI00158FE94D|nr:MULTISPECIES: SNF2-related protein [Pseudoalteromonas]MDW7548159.1 SNF2-related protein [Pseudoalteromonas peptidolytica]NUZ10301.1 DEAD/DEAH box helicase family protein [Pseudoalteromonas sp. McH1-7]
MQFDGWQQVADLLLNSVDDNNHLDEGQKISVRAMIKRLQKSGVIIADEVGMGKTRIAVEIINAVKRAGGRVLVIIPSNLGFQWQTELAARDPWLKSKPVLTSLWRFLDAYSDTEHASAWSNEQIVLLSQRFASWRVSENSNSARFALLPQVFAQHCKSISKRFPNGYKNWSDMHVSTAANCAKEIVQRVDTHPVLTEIVKEFNWRRAMLDSNFFSDEQNKTLLKKAVGLGLGEFDLVVIDEAHKSRGDESSLNAILEHIVLQTATARRVAMTATPVELDVGQWGDILNRICVPQSQRDDILKVAYQYVQTITQLRKTWRADQKIVQQYQAISKRFEQALSPYLLRRDKRQDKYIRDFCRVSGLSINAYRRYMPILIEVSELSPRWKQIVCAVEGFSAAAHKLPDGKSKRARLTLGSGHGIAEIIDSAMKAPKYTKTQDTDVATYKKQQRANWWQSVITQSYQSGEASLYSHPAIIKVVNEIEQDLRQGQKVLVFGKMTRPMRALTNLLNARAMLKSLKKKTYWPQSKIWAGGKNHEESEEFAVKMACKQLNISWTLTEINQKLRKQYKANDKRLSREKNTLIKKIAKSKKVFDSRTLALFEKFQTSQQAGSKSKNITPFMHAIFELADKASSIPSSVELAKSFMSLMDAVSAKAACSESDNPNMRVSDEQWRLIEERVSKEFGHVRGAMARFMYGDTDPHSRKVMQLGFNREHSYPRVMVAQSTVGREGLNLHRACRVVYLLHPEWNPGVVEQQIGRVDRIGSRWQKEFKAHQANQASNGELPFIEIKPVIFKGTYDEYNWQVLHARWDELRSQLHGIILPGSERSNGDEALYDKLCAVAPDFSPK